MRKKIKLKKRKVLPDSVYGSPLVTRMINYTMQDGKKSIARSIVYGAMDILENKTKKKPLTVLEEAMKNIMPEIELKVRRIGAVNYQIPVETTDERKVYFGFKWLIKCARLRSEKTMRDKLAAEIMDAANGVGATIKKRDEIYKIAEANKAYAHYRW